MYLVTHYQNDLHIVERNLIFSLVLYYTSSKYFYNNLNIPWVIDYITVIVIILFLQTIALNKENSDTWVKYATFLKSIGDIERAKECCLEAIALDTRSSKAWAQYHFLLRFLFRPPFIDNNKERLLFINSFECYLETLNDTEKSFLIVHWQKYSTKKFQCYFRLLVYAMILFENREYREAEIFLRALTNFYPRFFEGWAVLHIFYIRTDYYAGKKFLNKKRNEKYFFS